MSFLRVSFLPIAVVIPLMLSSCSTQQGEQQVAVERPGDEPAPAASLGSDREPEPGKSEPETELGQRETGPEVSETASNVVVETDETTQGKVEPEPSDEAPRQKVEERKSSQAARAKGEINFDDLKFDLEKDQPFDDSLLTDTIRELNGTTVKLRGYILPSTLFSETNISQFVLVRDNQECCFGPGAALFDCVMVEMVPGQTTDFVTRPVTVEGKFVIDTESYRYPPGYSPTKATHLAVFRIEGEAVQ